MKKYYGYFRFDDQEYVIRFRINGSLQWDDRFHCFKDKDWYCRSYEELICSAVYNTHPINLGDRFSAMGLSHKGFVDARAHGYKRYPDVIIDWD